MAYFHLVLGTGPLGLATAKALVDRGEFVRLVNRSGSVPGLPPGAAITAESS
jgi:2-polyprenyl-6-methoxyphenol hydroxylase-like FAD-dependent oxidoreductase